MMYLIAGAQLQTQKKQTVKPVFQNIFQAGLLTGESKSAYQVQTISGLKYKTWFGGIGIGIDNYLFRSVPVFIDVRKDVFDKSSTPFVFADAGAQLAWVPSGQKVLTYFNQDYDGKLYLNAGAGYKIHVIRRNALMFSAAFSLKKINVNAFAITREGQPVYCDPAACPEQAPITDKYTLKRLSLMLSWSIW